MPRDAAELLGLLDLETLDDDLFRGTQMPTSRPMVFGGQVAAQALVAASRTVEAPYAAHSLHSYFLQPGDPSVPTIYDVETLRDGRSFVTRRVIAQQHGRPIYAQTVNFHLDEPGLEHREEMPAVPGPDDPSVTPISTKLRDELHADQWKVAELRIVGTSARGLDPDPAHPGRQRVWLRVSSPLPDDPLVHRAAFTFLSDMTLVGAALAPHGVSFGPQAFVASLDHAVWFHRPFRADEWWLYDQVSPAATSGRGLVIARVFTEDGTLVASVAQEAVVRPRKGA
jgi:acyl-CoA thioesterase II